VQRIVSAHLGDQFPPALGRRIPAPPAEPMVTVEALAGSFMAGTRPATRGERYRVPASTAEMLEHVGKAKRV
jgi:hypothetical protein